MPSRKNNGAAIRAIARQEARNSEEPIRWEGAGDYSYEMTPEGVRATGGEKSKTLTGGRSTMLSFDDQDPRNLDMLEAITREWWDSPAPPEQTTPAPGAPRGPEGEYYGEGVSLAKAFAPQGARSSQAARSKPPQPNQIGIVPPKDAIDAEYWTPPATKSQKRRAAVQAAMTGVKPGQVMEYEGRRMMPVYDTKTGRLTGEYISSDYEEKQDYD